MNKKKKVKKIKIYRIDASKKTIGRLASEVAILIRGKGLPNYTPNNLPAVEIEIINIDQIKISEKKLSENIFYRYSGYPGGLKSKKWRVLYEKSPELLFMKVLNNMIPSNKLKRHLLKKIKFK